ncbi:hypothetical protein ACH4UT_21280 [Streptomyces sp. NPDC020799]|uniref:hypothetical protein n=1 Tax=Streptomyces sp. NPDC020799 TaxID=3365091 RepID=UPI0037B9D2A7
MRRKAPVFAISVLAALLSGCAGSDRDPYVATAADPAEGTIPPLGGVELIPLPPSPSASSLASPPASPSASSLASPPPSASPSPSPGPALRVGPLHRAPDPAGRRWCDKVTLTFTNTGPRPITTGKVTFATHVFDATGAERATLPSSSALPTIGVGRWVEGAWSVCADEGRVGVGMRVETRVVSATP